MRRAMSTLLERDCLFQLNVLLWAAMPQPDGAPVIPVLHQAGYTLFAIELPLDASTTERALITGSDPKINPNPVPDAVFIHHARATLVLVECKPDSFTRESERAPQGRGMIAAAGNIKLRMPGTIGSLAEVCYLVPMDAAVAMDTTLMTLLSEVSAQGFAGCPTSPVGVFVKSDGVYLGLTARPQGSAYMPSRLIPERCVVAVSAGQDPRPLYIIPWIPGAEDPTDLLAFKEKIRAFLLSSLGRAPIGTVTALSFGDILDGVSRGVYQQWRDRRTMEGGVFSKVASIIALLLDDDTSVVIRRNEVRVRLDSEGDRQHLLEHVRMRGLAPNFPDAVQLQFWPGDTDVGL